jgi:RNA polymerase sigma-70 factor (ECF subfamily)
MPVSLQGSPDLGCEVDVGAGVTKGHFRRKLEIDDADAQGKVLRAVALAKRGDRDAVRYLYVRYADNVYGYVLSIVRDEHDAEDITQHVFAKLMTVIAKYEPRSVAFSAWILRVARNAALDHLRRRQPIPVEEVRGVDTPATEQSEQSEQLQEALDTLPHDQRTVLLLRHVVGLTPGEIAQRLGRSESSVHGLHHRGRQSARETLTRAGCAPRHREPVA